MSPAEWAFALAAVSLIYAGHYFYGALVTDVAMVVLLGFCGLLGYVLLNAELRRDLTKTRGLLLPAATFLALLVFCLLSLTPWLPGGPHPVWAFTGLGAPAVTIDKSSTLVEIIKLAGLACVFAVGAATGGSSRRGRAVLALLVAFGVVFGLWAFLGAVTGFIPQTQGRRLEGHFLNPNTAGTLFGSLFVIGLAIGIDRLRRAKPGKVAAAVGAPVAACLVFLVCLLLSGSRGGALATLTAAAFVTLAHLLFGGGRLSRGAIIALAVAAASVSALYFAGSMVAERFADVNEAAIVRTSIWAEHWKAFRAAPLAGYGLGTSESVNKSLIGLSNFNTLWNIRAVLNVYLQWLEQAGVIGAALMFSTIGIIIVVAIRGLLKGTRAQLAVLGLLGLDIVFLVHGATDFALETPSMAILWAYLLGLQLSLSQRSRLR